MYEEAKYSMVTIFRRTAHWLFACVATSLPRSSVFFLEKGGKIKGPRIEVKNNREAAAQ